MVRFIRSSISNGLPFWSVYHTTISSYSELNVLWLEWEISSKLPKDLFGQKYIVLVNNVDNHYLSYYNELILLH